MRKLGLWLGLVVGLGGCADVINLLAMPAETRQEPIYCYRYLSGVECYKTPVHRDEKRLVNYQGPAPESYPKPPPPPEQVLAAPPATGFYVRDPDPVPESPPRLDKVRTSPDLTSPPPRARQGLPDLGGLPPIKPAPRKPVTPEKS
jgi:hypothetical protein